MDYFALGKRIRKRRVEQGMTQEQLARQVGVTTSFIGHLERGSRKASLETLVALANALHVGVDYLLCDSLNTVRGRAGTAPAGADGRTWPMSSRTTTSPGASAATFPKENARWRPRRCWAA